MLLAQKVEYSSRTFFFSSSVNVGMGVGFEAFHVLAINWMSLDFSALLRPYKNTDNWKLRANMMKQVFPNDMGLKHQLFIPP